MRAVVQRVLRAEVSVAGEIVGRIGAGLCVLVGVGSADGPEDADLLGDKLVSLRIFEDAEGKMNLDLRETGGALLAVSQFTLFGDVRKGRRPGFTDAMAPGPAEVLFERCCARIRAGGVQVAQGRFRTEMEVSLVNHGPVTILVDTKRTF